MSGEESPTRDSSAIYVELEGRSESLAIGRNLAGDIAIELARDAQLRGIFVSLVCSVSSGTTRESLSLSSTRIDGSDQSGTSHRRYPFSIGVPEVPLTHCGPLIRVDWRLHAHTMLPGAHRLATSVPVRVVNTASPHTRRVVGSHDSGGWRFVLGVLGAVVFAALGVAVGLPFALAALADPVLRPTFGLITAMILAAVAYGMADALRNAAGTALVGRVGLQIQGDPSPGNTLTISVHRPPGSLRFPQVGQATLAVSERVRVQRVRRMTTDVHTLHEDVKELAPVANTGGSILTCSFVLPDQELPDPFSFTSASCLWELRLRAPLGRVLAYRTNIRLRIGSSARLETRPD